MTQYIKKSALVAEIKTRIETYNKGYANGDDCRADALETFLHDIDFFDIKEVNLEKELDYRDYMNFFKEHPEYSNRDWGFDECWAFAKYFFELGLKAQKGE